MKLSRTYERLIDGSETEKEYYTLDLHPLEEAEILAERELLAEEALLPVHETTDELVRLIVMHGADYTREHVMKIQAAIDSKSDVIEKLKKNLNEKREKWLKHCKKCEVQNIDRNMVKD